MAEGDDFIDAEAYSNTDKNAITFKFIVLEHLRKIGVYASVEMRGGYYDIRYVNHPNHTEEIKTYIPDTRETYSHAVGYLYDLLYPHFDDEMLKIGEKAEDSILEVYEQYTEADNSLRKFAAVKYKDAYRDKRFEINRLLFRELNKFLKRKGYLEIGVYNE